MAAKDVARCVLCNRNKPVIAKGLCSRDYYRLYRKEQKRKKPPKVWLNVGQTCVSCDQPAFARGRCARHYHLMRRGSDPQTPPQMVNKGYLCFDCDKDAHARGYCLTHYMLARREGILEVVRRQKS